jgi:DNA repair exonuclease SbcCD ATPase subunit
MELSAYLQDKQELLDRRESEMNARLAVLENESRIARLRNELRLKGITDQSNIDVDDSTENSIDNSDDGPLDYGIALDTYAFSMPDPTSDDETESDEIEFVPLSNRDEYKPHRTVSDAERRLRAEFAANTRAKRKLAAKRIKTSRKAPEPDHEKTTEQLDAMRQALQDHKAALDNRERHLEALHDQITELHRESLELRVATEQVWTDFRGHMPDEALAKSLANHREKLVDHYKLANDELCRRRQILHELQQQIGHQEEQLRSERLDLQMWVDRQRNDVEAKSATMTAREYEFERREAELQRQSITWQKQREDYRHEIEQLSRRLRYANA